MGVQVRLVDGSQRRGLLVNVDPQTGAAALFVQPTETPGNTSCWKACILFREAVASFEQVDVGDMTLARLEAAHPLLMDEVSVGGNAEMGCEWDEEEDAS